MEATDTYLTESRAMQTVNGWIESLGYTPEQVFRKDRSNPVKSIRQCVIYYLQFHTMLTLKQIGAAVGGLDHSTVISARRRVENALQGYDDALKALYDSLIIYIYNNNN